MYDLLKARHRFDHLHSHGVVEQRLPREFHLFGIIEKLLHHWRVHERLHHLFVLGHIGWHTAGETTESAESAQRIIAFATEEGVPWLFRRRDIGAPSPSKRPQLVLCRPT